MSFSVGSVSNYYPKGGWRDTENEPLTLVRFGEAGGSPVFWKVMHGISGSSDQVRMISESCILSLTDDEFSDFMDDQMNNPIISFTNEEWNAALYMPLPAPRGYTVGSYASIENLAATYSAMSETHYQGLASSGSIRSYINPPRPYPDLELYRGNPSWKGHSLFPYENTWWVYDDDPFVCTRYVDSYGTLRYASRGERHGVRLIIGIDARGLAGSAEKMRYGAPSELLIPSRTMSRQQAQTQYFVIG